MFGPSTVARPRQNSAYDTEFPSPWLDHSRISAAPLMSLRRIVSTSRAQHMRATLSSDDEDPPRLE